MGVDAPVVPTSLGDSLVPLYPTVDGAPAGWSQGLDGTGVSVAVIDSGITTVPDLTGRVVQVPVGSAAGTGDAIGHGTFVASVLGGLSLDGRYVGVAPGARLFALDVDSGSGIYTSDVVQALSWVAANAASNGIRVVNLSLTETAPSSYATSALDSAVEAVWRSGVTVVVAAGNSGAGQINYAPANDPYVITVGASDPNGTVSTVDDTEASWSSSGTTFDGYAKPDLLAPGRGIVAALPSGTTLDLAAPFGNHVEPGYVRMNGTSFSAPQVAGAVADLLQQNPALTPDQIKTEHQRHRELILEFKDELKK